MSYHIVHLRAIIHPKANHRNAPKTIWNLFEEKYWELTTVAALIRDVGAELKLIPGCPAGPGAQAHHNGYDQQPKNELSSKLQFLQCNYSKAFDPRCTTFCLMNAKITHHCCLLPKLSVISSEWKALATMKIVKNKIDLKTTQTTKQNTHTHTNPFPLYAPQTVLWSQNKIGSAKF